ncbi:MAG: hypothetical protein D6737_04890 [Chloroflexi bacterium]|nr:MAG: hypothetical protein CUN54_06030 [Phototrophicales bacterium]RMF81479.1 MAG: hypothetical protein D6737_04890 [Chloroflexota bacterium]
MRKLTVHQWIQIATLVVLLAFIAITFINRQMRYPAEITELEAHYSAMKSRIPAGQTMIGFDTDRTGLEKDTNRHVARYALVPFVVHPWQPSCCEYVVGRFNQANLPAKYTVVEYFGADFYLLRQERTS